MNDNDSVNVPSIVAIVPAAGIGSRMQRATPKQYLTLNGKTILEHAVTALFAHPAVRRAIVALHPQDTGFDALPLAADRRVSRVTGGATRAESVLAALLAADDADWVLVHDAARPCLRPDDLAHLMACVDAAHQGAILATPVCDTMKRAEAGLPLIAHTVARQDLWHALTPQLFPRALLIQCLQRALREGATVTDEASALEHCGYHPRLVSGRSDNIKVTRPEDLALAEFYLARHASLTHSQEQ
ncbi:2-C-methyl-D-erythritol 4-phosphate cytidylyltransferase [Edwardsiella piscicida]|uniref:2-C-methyl-D-erythritol 4-phosphate cytidylyltransferase n=3 Tax=Edwardsiella TaxID=635 RepID=A0A0H3DTX9_EDWTF|nr:2-C-methyl-D-erythritol 4-phosphate cytidylyltransferase [Edwardsiella piscicida]ACY85712.1 2-C-methyl-D-erythritol 4-phosphate cytidylyltransferase [Edwardsiella tarda EIB202]ADM42717.1 2-C-methyl-D-erythritol 4-phosphate cytidylyltransferase [Edwardsiella tarda FL6-60]ARD20102.1 2-C-methyl-D-erythritol 4-phosphate cytidylyltransferase [Edwardsiella piscicida]EKS7767645.1 2-C-methyl-D-erythritol 4-phosphate cytidylyltransferase [Edwardsiella piscicida]EKS7813873.1 2-C-methyl-D-erythritol 4